MKALKVPSPILNPPSRGPREEPENVRVPRIPAPEWTTVEGPAGPSMISTSVGVSNVSMTMAARAIGAIHIASMQENTASRRIMRHIDAISFENGYWMNTLWGATYQLLKVNCVRTGRALWL